MSIFLIANTQQQHIFWPPWRNRDYEKEEVVTLFAQKEIQVKDMYFGACQQEGLRNPRPKVNLATVKSNTHENSQIIENKESNFIFMTS